VQHYEFTTDPRPLSPSTKPAWQYSQFYAAEGSTARATIYDITYDPRDAVFSLALNAQPARVKNEIRFQDPLHRIDFGGTRQPQEGTPNFESQGFLQLQVDTTSVDPAPTYDVAQSTIFPIGGRKAFVDHSTFFYQKPGTNNQYVTLAGFVRNATNIPEDTRVPYIFQNHTVERGVFAYGERTSIDNVPKIGSATFRGPMISSLVYNDRVDTDIAAATYFQWMTGTSTTNINFAANTFTFSTNGTVGAPSFGIYSDRIYTLREGATFEASGKGLINLVQAGGFVGQFDAARFVQPNGTVLQLQVAGSSIDGTFFGPAGQEIGGAFRIVGGVPDERVDIVGAFIGK
jgi:hypothetical protein